MNNFEASIKDPPGQHVTLLSDPAHERPIPKVFLVCDQRNTAPVWG